MEDLTSKLSELLNSPDGLDTIKSMASAIMGGSSVNSEKPAEPAQPPTPELPISPEQIQTFMRLSSALSKANTDDSTSKLLLALRPHLGIEKQQKIDKAIKLLKLVHLMPLIQESGIMPF